MLELPDDWVWDMWTADDGSAYHLFFLRAPRSLGDPDLRHVHASVGHAVSDDLVSWTRLDDAFGPQLAPAYDELSTWTGSVVRDDDGGWRMFTTGLAHELREEAQSIGVSTSPDLRAWSRRPEALVVADPRWYVGPHWRDPWVVRDEAGLWHMYVTATVGRAGEGRGVVGHAISRDLEAWEVRAPLSDPGGRFDQLEVISLHEVEGRWVMLFSCLAGEMPGAEPGSGGVWSLAVDGPGAHVDPSRAVRLTSEDLYVGKLVDRREGGVRFVAFENREADGAFGGRIIDPCRIAWDEAGTGLVLLDGPERWRPSDPPSANVYERADHG